MHTSEPPPRQCGVCPRLLDARHKPHVSRLRAPTHSTLTCERCGCVFRTHERGGMDADVRCTHCNQPASQWRGPVGTASFHCGVCAAVFHVTTFAPEREVRTCKSCTSLVRSDENIAAAATEATHYDCADDDDAGQLLREAVDVPRACWW